MRFAHSHPGSESTDEFVPLGAVEERIPRIDRNELERGPLTFLAEDGFEARIPREFLERMVQYGRRAAPNEWLAVLVGRVGEDGRGRYVALRGAVLDDGALARPGYVETSPESEARTRTLARTLYPDCSIVGWAHGHVRIGARFSGKDRENQRTWTRPDSLGVVVDPWSSEWIGVYRGPGAERLRLAGRGDAVAQTGDCPECGAPATPQVEANPPSEGSTRMRFVEDAGAIIATLILSIGIAASAYASLRAYQKAEAATANISALEARVESIADTHARSTTDQQPDFDLAELACHSEPAFDAGVEDSATGASDVVPIDARACGADPAAPAPQRMRIPIRHAKPPLEAGPDIAADAIGADAGPREDALAGDVALDSDSTGRH